MKTNLKKKKKKRLELLACEEEKKYLMQLFCSLQSSWECELDCGWVHDT